jgi:murein DD-endopeptidase MepM/ murein hydrolase activator NlpD
MDGTHRERLTACIVGIVERYILPARRAIASATALLLVTSAVLLVLDARLPFPSPGEGILYDPTDWSLLFHAADRPRPPRELGPLPGPSVGGASVAQPPLAVLLYKVRPGDTVSGLAIALGMNVDTISSMNRVAGRGVHNVTVGEVLKIPSQDGIFMAAADDFDEQCRKNEVLPEDVLAANAVSREEVSTGRQLFFPNVQHTGYAYALSVGVGVALPLHGWQTDRFGRRLDPFTGQASRHYGVDIAAPEGSVIRSATDGVVTQAGWDEGYGNFVQVRAQLGYSYIYGHMSRIATHAGARVSTGQALGYVGHTGHATGPHLHFEVRLYGVPQNPRNYLPAIR